MDYLMWLTIRLPERETSSESTWKPCQKNEIPLIPSKLYSVYSATRGTENERILQAEILSIFLQGIFSARGVEWT